MHYPKSQKYQGLIAEKIMGPNPVKLTEELLSAVSIPERAEIRQEVEAQLTATAEYQKLEEEVQKAEGENAVEVENVAAGEKAAENEGGNA